MNACGWRRRRAHGHWELSIPGKQLVWSAELEAIYGLPSGTFSTTFESFQAVIHPHDRQRVAEANSTHGQRRGRSPCRVSHRAAQRRVRWIEGRGRVFRDTSGRPQRVSGVCLDVTDRKAADEEARATARRRARRATTPNARQSHEG